MPALFALVLSCASHDSGGLSLLTRSHDGTVSSLYFAVTGDTRPATQDDTAGYPIAVIDSIFSGIAALTPAPSFIVATGDYEFASTRGSESLPQLDLYMQARARFPGPFFPAMGNHECTGYTDSNCGPGNRDGVTAQFSAFLALMLAPIAEPLPYYVVRIGSSPPGLWTSKLVFIAANAWDEAQASWLAETLAERTTYTFVIRHEPQEATTAPGTTPSEALVAREPVTLFIAGHTHTYGHDGNRVVVGNGGAPLSGSKGYGFVLVKQRQDGAIEVDEYDAETGQADPAFHFAVTAGGEITG